MKDQEDSGNYIWKIVPCRLFNYRNNILDICQLISFNTVFESCSPLVADASRRRTFIKSAIRFLRQYNFDGLDLDWEYPSFRDGGKPEDRRNYAKFVAVSIVPYTISS